MIPNLIKPYLYLGAIVAICLGIGYVYTLPEKYRDEGRREIDAKYQEESRIAINKRNAEIERVKLEQTEINRKVVADYENKLKSLSDRLADAKSIGLRVPKSACSGIAANTEATSTKPDNETEYIRLPERIESGLFRIAERAQEINIQLSACQSWIIQNGFYPSDLSSTPNK